MSRLIDIDSLNKRGKNTNLSRNNEKIFLRENKLLSPDEDSGIKIYEYIYKDDASRWESGGANRMAMDLMEFYSSSRFCFHCLPFKVCLPIQSSFLLNSQWSTEIFIQLSCMLKSLICLIIMKFVLARICIRGFNKETFKQIFGWCHLKEGEE